MTEDRGDFRARLAEPLGRRGRHSVLEETLFHRLTERDRSPLEQLGRLVRTVVEELRIAQHRVARQADDVRALKETVAGLTARVDLLSEQVAAGRAERRAEPPAGHALLLSTPDGYRLVARAGAAPAPGETLEHEGARYRVLGNGRSPLPGDPMPSLLALPD